MRWKTTSKHANEITRQKKARFSEAGKSNWKQCEQCRTEYLTVSVNYSVMRKIIFIILSINPFFCVFCTTLIQVNKNRFHTSVRARKPLALSQSALPFSGSFNFMIYIDFYCDVELVSATAGSG